MRTLSKTIVALGLVALMAGPVVAQQGRGGGRGFGGGFGGGLGGLLGNASVQQELKLDATQVDKAKDVAAKAREKFTSARESLQGLQGDERMKKMTELTRESNTEVNKAIGEFLSKDQIHRLHQIQRQQQGAMAFADEHVQSKLKLTDAQKGEIHSIVEASNSEAREIMQGFQSDREGTMAKLTEHRKATLDKVVAKLTDEQKTTWKDLLGSHFEIKYEPRPGGGGGGR
jgi:hypothetical protein